ncbi:MAG TPA: hypothetical protein VGR37_13780 [Longimicrobiaceae bacterium]|nr:hypothetical protein [Longimicrobiaceae bacterium]
MSRPTLLAALLVTLGLAACEAGPPAAPPSDHSGASHGRAAGTSADLARQLAALRRETAAYHNFDKAVEAGYTERITPCWAHRTLGAMGYHYGNPGLIDGTVELLRPELLIYEPGPSGHLRLVGLEYIVPIDAWEGKAPPTLLGQEFHPHSFLPIYKLHVWLWRDNPRGTFADWNPTVSCQHAAETEVFE